MAKNKGSFEHHLLFHSNPWNLLSYDHNLKKEKVCTKGVMSIEVENIFCDGMYDPQLPQNMVSGAWYWWLRFWMYILWRILCWNLLIFFLSSSSCAHLQSRFTSPISDSSIYLCSSHENGFISPTFPFS